MGGAGGELGSEPGACRDDDLRPFAGGEIEAEPADVPSAVFVEPKDLERAAS